MGACCTARACFACAMHSAQMYLPCASFVRCLFEQSRPQMEQILGDEAGTSAMVQLAGGHIPPRPRGGGAECNRPAGAVGIYSTMAMTTAITTHATVFTRMMIQLSDSSRSNSSVRRNAKTTSPRMKPKPPAPGSRVAAHTVVTS